MIWTYNDEPFTDPPDNAYGFIYLLICSDGSKYIGKKNFFSDVTLPALKSGVQRPNSTRIGRNSNGKRVYFDIVRKDSDWRTYNSSSKLIKDKVITSKEILAISNSKRNLTYLETKYLFIHSVLESDEYLNDNILGKFFSNSIE